jgi:hypothetical protein
MDLFHLDVDQYIKEFGMMEKPLADYSEQINEYHARVLEAQVRTENVIDCNLVRVMVFDFKQTFIDRAEYVCTRLKSQVAPLLSLSLLLFLPWHYKSKSLYTQGYYLCTIFTRVLIQYTEIKHVNCCCSIDNR